MIVDLEVPRSSRGGGTMRAQIVPRQKPADAAVLSGHKDIVSRIDKSPARDHDPAGTPPFNRLYPSGTRNDFSGCDLDCAVSALEESHPVVDVADDPVR